MSDIEENICQGGSLNALQFMVTTSPPPLKIKWQDGYYLKSGLRDMDYRRIWTWHLNSETEPSPINPQ